MRLRLVRLARPALPVLVFFTVALVTEAFRFAVAGGLWGIEPLGAGHYGPGQELFGLPARLRARCSSSAPA